MVIGRCSGRIHARHQVIGVCSESFRRIFDSGSGPQGANRLRPEGLNRYGNQPSGGALRTFADFKIGAAPDSERAAVLCFLLLQQPLAFDPIAAREGTTGPPRLGANGFL